MKLRNLFASVALTLLIPVTLLAQGTLAPTGTPGPTMKSLDQIEARTPISSTPFLISSPGSYYLTKNLTIASGYAIVVNANNVTVDLNGFNLASTENSGTLGGTGIRILATYGVTIRNGSISGSVTYSGGTFSGAGFGKAISCEIAGATNMRVSGVSVSGCYSGINLAASSSGAEFCTVDTVAGRGITATSISHCSALNCGSDAMVGNNVSDSFGTSVGGAGDGVYCATAVNCYGSAGGTGDGIYATTATNCWGVGVGGHGVTANEVNNCYGTTAGSDKSGINGITIQNSYGTSSSSGPAINAISALNCYGYNSGNGDGLAAAVAGNCNGSAAGSGDAIDAIGGTATNCNGTSNSGRGVTAYVATNCQGDSTSSTGLNCQIANNCRGSSSSAPGLNATQLAVGCRGATTSGYAALVTSSAAFCSGYRPGGTAISATIANGCIADSGAIVATYKYNMP